MPPHLLTNPWWKKGPLPELVGAEGGVDAVGGNIVGCNPVSGVMMVSKLGADGVKGNPVANAEAQLLTCGSPPAEWASILSSS